MHQATAAKSLLVMDARSERQALARIACPTFEVEVASNREELQAALMRVRPDVVIADGNVARAIVKQLDQAAPDSTRIFSGELRNPEALDALVRMASEGHLFHTLDESLNDQEWCNALRSILQMRGSKRSASFSDLSATFEHEGNRFKAQVTDVGFHGVGLFLPLDHPRVERLQPGNDIRSLTLESRLGVILRDQISTLQHVRVIRSPEGNSLRLGISLRARKPEPAPNAPLLDPIRILSVLRRVQNRGTALSLQSTRPGSKASLATSFSIVHAKGRSQLIFSTPRQGNFEAGDVLELHFEFNGQGHVAHVGVVRVESGELVVSLPTVVQRPHRRQAVRFRPRSGQQLVVSVAIPFNGSQILRPVLDLQVGGLSFVADATVDALPLGLMLSQVALGFPDGRIFHCDAVVESATPLDDTERSFTVGMQQPVRCGLRLENVAAPMQDAILQAYRTAAYPGFDDGHFTPFEEVWELWQEAGRTFLDYPAETRNQNILVLGRAQQKLSDASGALGKSFVYRDQGKLRATANGLRLYDKTWLLQHLTVAPGFHRDETVSQKMSSLVMEYGEAQQDIEFLRYEWFTATRWTARISTWIAHQLATEGLTHLRHYTLVTQPMPQALSIAGGRLRAREANPEELKFLESYLRRDGALLSLRADDLTAEEITMKELGNRFARHGMRRARKVFVVDDGHAPLGFALAEEATAGLCWPELTNAFRLVVPTHEPALRAESISALVRRCALHYNAMGRTYLHAVPDDVELGTLLGHGFSEIGRIAEWTFHKSLGRQWQELLTAMFERLTRRPSAGQRKELAA